MFRLSDHEPVTLEDFLADYRPSEVLGMMQFGSDGHIKYQSLNVGDIIKKDLQNMPDTYLAYNPLKYYGRRTKERINKLSFLYVDLDIAHDNPFENNIDFESMAQFTIAKLEQEYFDKIIPAPSYIALSGRGLYLLYKIWQSEDQAKPEHKNAAERWRRVNSFLTDQLEWFASDRSVRTDESRILRVPGTVNTKVGKEVKFYKYSDNKYTLYNIERDYMSAPTESQLIQVRRMEELLGVRCEGTSRRYIRRFIFEHKEAYTKANRKEQPTDKQIKYAQDMAATIGIECPAFRTKGGVDTFIKKHMKTFKEVKEFKHQIQLHLDSNAKPTDQEKEMEFLRLRLHRLEQVLIDASEGSRELMMFYYRCYALQYTQDENKALEMLLAVREQMANPLSKKETIYGTKSAEAYWRSGSLRKMSDAVLCEKLGISLEEFKEIKAPRKDPKEQKSAINRRYYERQLEKSGKNKKKDTIIARRESISRMLNDGKNKKEILAELSISARTYYDDIKAIEAETATEEVAQYVDIECAKNSDGISNYGLIDSKESISPLEDAGAVATASCISVSVESNRVVDIARIYAVIEAASIKALGFSIPKRKIESDSRSKKKRKSDSG